MTENNKLWEKILNSVKQIWSHKTHPVQNAEPGSTKAPNPQEQSKNSPIQP